VAAFDDLIPTRPITLPRGAAKLPHSPARDKPYLRRDRCIHQSRIEGFGRGWSASFMSQGPPTIAPLPAHLEFARRSLSLGVICGSFDSQLSITFTDGLAVPLREWLSSPRFSKLLASALGDNTAEPWQPLPVFDGCDVLLPGGSLTSQFALILRRSVVADPLFEQLCESAGASPLQIECDLAPFLREDSFEVRQLIDVLRHFHDDLHNVQTHNQTIKHFAHTLSQSYEEVNLLFRMARFLNCLNDPIEIMEMSCNQLREALPFAWMAFWFGDRTHVLTPLAGRLIASGDLPCPMPRFTRLAAEMLERSDADNWTSILTPGNCELAAIAGSEILVEPISHEGRAVGILLAGNKRGLEPQIISSEIQLLDAASDFLGLFHENMCRFAEQRAQFMGTLQALTAVVDAKDPYTCGHSERVGLLASQLARKIGLDARECENYRISGLVHDIGKIGVPEAVLLKPTRLTEEEFAHIKRHPEIGFRILKDIPSMSCALPGVLYHHERWDGQGYPHGLAKDRIPLMARVLALADTFDAMSSVRSYRTFAPRNYTLEEIARCAGSQFDPQLTESFLTLNLADYDEMVKMIPPHPKAA
jgi:HD-GYP domain-containing protein (c-di-GMP phosphodiesterase class II)